MSLTFYFAAFSTASATAALLDELEHGLPSPLAKRIELSISAGDTRAPEYLSTVNPNGLVPAIVHDGVPIWESAAIAMYLGETFGVERGLYPGPGPKRGEAMKWIVWTNTTLVQAGRALATALPADTPGSAQPASHNYEPGRKGSETGAAKAEKDLGGCLAILDGALQGKEFLLGKEYSLTDTHVAAFVNWIEIMGTKLDDYASVTAWKARVAERPASKKH